MISDIYSEIVQRAEASPNREVCGFLLHDGYGSLTNHPVENITKDDPSNHFEVSSDDQVRYMMTGQVKIFYHSHTKDDESPSKQDIACANAMGLAFLIYSVSTGKFSYYKPATAIEPLLSRRYIVSYHDCFSLMEDYFRLERGHVMPFFRRSPVEAHHGCSHAIDYMKQAGFKTIEKIEETGDVLLLSNCDSGKINHCGIYQGDGTFIHQMLGRVSDRSNLTTWQPRIKGMFRLP